ncbi:hypothetical protein CR162_18530 [Pseudoroseomonas rhizosphaerae]|uniref:Uncharacterized protein n=1 Tax=Teichococcus rhizosphaerae TaxID=1335062 RepID=A0A2C7A655_9PROT|nr:hypothetical protein [Pseudoroseomonas rhizosphaerae]PHK93469.1 hypothetical protein CR162_18530 [Pseudoroseomonas rhizosphaerae]
MPNNDREVFEHFLSDPDASPEVAHLAYAAYAASKYDWATRFEELKGRPPAPAEVDQWIAELPMSRFVEIRATASETFALAAQTYMRDEIEKAKAEAVRASIFGEVQGISRLVEANNKTALVEARAIRERVEKATSFKGTWLPNTFTGIIASLAFSVIVLVIAMIYQRDPSLFALFKGASPPPVSTPVPPGN